MLKNSKISKKYRQKRKLDQKVRQIRREKEYNFEIDFSKPNNFGSMLQELSLDEIQNQLKNFSIQKRTMTNQKEHNVEIDTHTKNDIIEGPSFKNTRIQMQQIFQQSEHKVERTKQIHKIKQQQKFTRQNILIKSRLRRTSLEKTT